MHIKTVSKHQALEIKDAIQDALDSYSETGNSHTVVYSNELGAAVSMPSMPDLHLYGWEIILTVGNKVSLSPVLVGTRAG